jgi:hypothetical protein
MKVPIVLLIVVLLMILFYFRTSGSKGDSWTIYGTDGCGWCKKQKSYMNSKGINYTFVDCSSGSCEGITGFPTLKNMETGEVKVGYTEL